MDTARRTRAGDSPAFGFVTAGVSVQLVTFDITTALWFGIDVLAAKAPVCTGALLAAKAVGCDHVIVDETLIATDRCRTPGPTPGVDLWWSGKHPIMAATSR